MPATLALLISSEQITSALFGYGSFDPISVKNSASALYFFSFGLPAFALIKVFSSYVFARHNTKTPFLFSVSSVTVNITLSVYFFDDFGFIIIPIATTISSWFNALLLFIFIIRKITLSLKDLFFFMLKSPKFNCDFFNLLSNDFLF